MISAQSEINEEMKQNLSVNKKFKKEMFKDEILSFKKQIHAKKISLENVFKKSHNVKLEIED